MSASAIRVAPLMLTDHGQTVLAQIEGHLRSENCHVEKDEKNGTLAFVATCERCQIAVFVRYDAPGLLSVIGQVPVAVPDSRRDAVTLHLAERNATALIPHIDVVDRKVVIKAAAFVKPGSFELIDFGSLAFTVMSRADSVFDELVGLSKEQQEQNRIGFR